MSLLRKLQFNLWYLGRAPWDSGISPPELFEFIRTHPAGRALDIGCGTGTNVITLAKAGWEVTGFDFAPRAIQIARRKAKSTNVSARFFVDEAARMEHIQGRFDLALDIGCYHGMDHKALYLAKLYTILAPKGFWLMYGFLKSASLTSGPGLAEADIDMVLSKDLRLVSRRDGFDKRERPSAWFLFQKT